MAGGALAVLVLSSCSSILGIDQDYSVEGDGGTGGAGGMTTTSTTSSLGGGGAGGGETTILMDYDDGDAGNDLHDADISGGGFDDTSASTDSSDFSEHAVWFNYDGPQDNEAALATIDNSGAKTDGSMRSGVLTAAKIFQASTADTGYTFATGDSHVIRFVWRDASQWDDATGTVTVALGYYDGEGSANFDSTADPFTDVSSIPTGTSAIDSTWEEGGGAFPDSAPPATAGKTLYVRITANDAFARIDNITLTAQRNGS